MGIATAFLLIAVNLGSFSSTTPMCVGFTVFAMATIIGPVSGGHMNPAVTLGMFIKHSQGGQWAQNAIYMVIIICSQIIGAMLGVSIASMACDGTVNEALKTQIVGGMDVTRVTMLCPATGCYKSDMMGRVFAGEIIATFLFVSLVLQIVKHNGANDGPTNTIAIGLGLFIAITLTGAISGGCVNPAVGFVQPVFQRVFTKAVYPNAEPVPLTYYGAYIFAPAIGGILAGIWSRTISAYAQTKAAECASNAAKNEGDFA